MKQMSLASLTLAVLAVSPALAQTRTPSGGVDVPLDMMPASQRAVSQVEPKLNEVTRRALIERERLRRLMEVSKPDSEVVKRQEQMVAEMESLQSSLEEEIRNIVEQDRQNQPAALLSRSVSVSFKDATVPQALEVLQKSSRVPLVADPAINTTKRLTIDAKNVSVGQVLESIGRQTDLEVTLEPGTGAIRVQTWPTLDIDGEHRVLKSDTAPWSDTLYRTLESSGAANNRGGDSFFQPIDESGNFPSRRRGFGSVARRVGGTANGFFAGGTAGGGSAVPETAVGTGFNPSVPASGPTPRATGGSGVGIGGVSLAPIADHMVVVAEAGRGPKGEPGVFLTVYRLEGVQLRKVSQVFHHAVNGAAAPGVPGMPGMMGMPGGAPAGGGGFGGGGGGFAPGAGGFPGGGGFAPGSGGFPGGGGFSPGAGVPGGGGFEPGVGAPTGAPGGGSPFGGGGFSPGTPGGGSPLGGGGGGALAPGKSAPRTTRPAKPKGTNPKAPAGDAGAASK